MIRGEKSPGYVWTGIFSGKIFPFRLNSWDIAISGKVFRLYSFLRELVNIRF